MGNELKAGLVGCGSVSQRGILPHLSLPDARQSVRLVAVADAVEERARESAQRFDVPVHFTSLEEMLATADLDLVLIATPIPDHFQNAMAEIDPSWYYRPGAGPLPDVTVYALQLATSVLGPVRRVTALANKGAPERTWRGTTIAVEVDDNNLLLLEFESGALAVAAGSNCHGSARIPWGGMGLYGTAGALEVTAVDQASGYPLRFEVEGGSLDQASRTYV